VPLGSSPVPHAGSPPPPPPLVAPRTPPALIRPGLPWGPGPGWELGMKPLRPGPPPERPNLAVPPHAGYFCGKKANNGPPRRPSKRFFSPKAKTSRNPCLQSRAAPFGLRSHLPCTSHSSPSPCSGHLPRGDPLFPTRLGGRKAKIPNDSPVPLPPKRAPRGWWVRTGPPPSTSRAPPPRIGPV